MWRCSYYTFIFLQKEEFQRSVDVSQYHFFRDHQVFVMWDWIWIDDEDHLSDESVERSDLELSDKSSEQEDSRHWPSSKYHPFSNFQMHWTIEGV